MELRITRILRALFYSCKLPLHSVIKSLIPIMLFHRKKLFSLFCRGTSTDNVSFDTCYRILVENEVLSLIMILDTRRTQDSSDNEVSTGNVPAGIIKMQINADVNGPWDTIPIVVGPIPEPEASSSSSRSWPSSSSSISPFPCCLQTGLSPLPEPSKASSARKASGPMSDDNWDCTNCYENI